jgi:hypothetical protein
MSLLQKLATDDSIAVERDSLGNNGPLESGIYKAKVALAYIITADSGALGLVLHLKTDTNREIRQTLWMTSGTAKGGNNFYIDKQGNKQYLPGFLHANSLALLTVGKEINQLDTEVKVVKLYSKEAKAEVPTKVDVITELLDQEILVGLIKQKVNKTQKNDAGVYVPSGETREENEIDKLFRARDGMTTAEIRAEAEEASFLEAWKGKWTGVTKDRTKGTTGNGVAGAPGMAGISAAAPTAKPKESLFA